MPAKVTIPIGTRFGRLVVLGPSPERRGSFACWGCRCDCGMIVVVSGVNLRGGHTLSCGCLLSDRNAEVHRKHGGTATPEYSSWCAMRQRCRNPASKHYRHYGGRGITICPAWDDFAAFFRDMGPKPSAAHTLDRIDVNGPYSPENCRWANPVQQGRNRRVTRMLTHDGQTRSVGDWASVTGLSVNQVHKRLRRGWTVEQALTVPLGEKVAVRSGRRWVLPERAGR
jgi:hypothetical protein